MRKLVRLLSGAALILLSGLLAETGPVAQPIDTAALAELQQRRNVAANVVERFALGVHTSDLEVVLKGYDVNPPFYRAVIDDTPARRRWARDRLRVHLGSLVDPNNLMAPSVDRGSLRLSANLSAARRLAASGYVHSISLADGEYAQALSLSDVLQTVNIVPDLSSQGLTGTGIRVATIDRDFNAAILGSVVVQEECFCRGSCCANGQTRQSGPGSSNIPSIVNNHGTEVASEIAYGPGGQGTAPGSRLVLLAAPQPEDLFDALDWLATQSNIAVLNLSLSLGDAAGTCDGDPSAGLWLPRIATLAAQNKVVVAASGNAGSRTFIGIPACLSQVTAVAGTWACTAPPAQKPPEPGCDAGAEFDRLWPGASTSLKVDTLAPAKPLQVPYLAPGGPPGYTYGTSNAAPVVAGCAALIRQARPNATGDQIRNALRVSPTQVTIPSGGWGSFNRGRLDCLAALQTIPPSEPPSVNLNQHGLTGLWYQPSTNGQGFAIEVFPNLNGPGQGLLSGGWFTYVPGSPGGVGTQRWFSLQGDVSSTQGTANLVIYRSVGGKFDASPIIQPTAVGTASIRFSDCTNGVFTYSFNSGVPEVGGFSGTINLTRNLPNITCSPGGGSHPDFLMSGNWFEPETSGQGLILELNPNSPRLFAAWYTYRPNGSQTDGPGGQRWFTIQADYMVGARSFPSLPIYETTGGVFDTTPPPGQPVTVQVGSANLSVGCTSATLHYSFTSGENAGLNGTIAATRVGPPPPGC